MKAHAHQSNQEPLHANQERQRQPSRNGLSTEATLEFVDNRPEAVAQGKLQALIQQSPHVQRLTQQRATITDSPYQVAQRQRLAGLFGRPVQRQPLEDDKLLQGKFANHAAPTQFQSEVEKPENCTGLPDNLKAGVEHFSGMAMGKVKVPHNASPSAQLNALAYTQGEDV